MTTAPILVVASIAMLAAPTRLYAGLRLRQLRAEGLGRSYLPGRRGLLGDHPLRTACVAAGLAIITAVGLAVASGWPSPVAPALAAASVGGVTGWLVSITAASRRERRLLGSLGAAVTALSAELRAGQSEPAALRAVAATADPELAVLLAGAGDVAAEAGDVARTLRESEVLSTLPAVVRSGLLRTAAAWAVSRDCGAPIASVLDHVEDDLRSHRRRSLQVDAQLAGPRATAVLLSLLPGLGMALGGAVGAHPVAVLLGTSVGQLALLVGACLDAIGVLWTVRIVRAAGRSP